MNLSVFVHFCEQRAGRRGAALRFPGFARACIPLTLVQTTVYWLFL